MYALLFCLNLSISGPSGVLGNSDVGIGVSCDTVYGLPSIEACETLGSTMADQYVRYRNPRGFGYQGAIRSREQTRRFSERVDYFRYSCAQSEVAVVDPELEIE